MSHIGSILTLHTQQAGGQLASLDVHDEESLVARFSSRATAEQVLAS